MKWTRSLLVLVGNLSEHYDLALFGLLAPLLAPLFFPNQEGVVGLILTYALLPLGVLFRPLGALFFGRIGDLFGRKRALVLSSFGIAAVTVAIGCLPVYAEVGIWAPLLLALARGLQAFFAAGESASSAIFILEQVKEEQKSLVSSLHGLSSMVGTLGASAGVMLLSLFDAQALWRLPFWLGGLTALAGFVIYFSTKESLTQEGRGGWLPWRELWQQRRAIIAVGVATGFAHVTYSSAFTFMNGWLPLVTPLTYSEVMTCNTLLLFADMALLPLFGWIAGKVGKVRLMTSAVFGLGIAVLPLFLLLQIGTLSAGVAVRTLFMLFGVAFSAPFYAWAGEQFPEKLRCTGFSLATALGAQFLGAPASAMMLWLYKETGWVGAPAIYVLLLVVLMALCFISLAQLRFNRMTHALDLLP